MARGIDYHCVGDMLKFDDLEYSHMMHHCDIIRMVAIMMINDRDVLIYQALIVCDDNMIDDI